MGHAYEYTTSKDIVDEIGKGVPIYEGIEVNRLRRKGFHWILSLYYKTKAENVSDLRLPARKPSAIKSNKKYPLYY